MTHINDTREEMPLCTVKANKPEDIRRAAEAAYFQSRNQMQNEINNWFFTAGNTDETKQVGVFPRLSIIDLRQPQNGISLRTFRTRYPRAQQLRTVAKVRRFLAVPTSVDEKPHSGKTAIRGSKLSENSY